MYTNIYYLADDGTRRHIGNHCAAWFVTHGYLPSDLMVLHKCGYKPCCNPTHLYLGNGHDNALDAIAEGNWSGNTRLEKGEVQAIRHLYGLLPPPDICDKFQISYGTFSAIIHGKTHKNAGGPLKLTNAKTQTHCHKGHPLTEENLVYTHGEKHFRQCRICYMETNRAKARRRLETNRDLINTQRRARRGSTVRRFTEEECAEIQSLYPEHTYRTLAERFDTTYSTIMRIIKGAYGGTRHLH